MIKSVPEVLVFINKALKAVKSEAIDRSNVAVTASLCEYWVDEPFVAVGEISSF